MGDDNRNEQALVATVFTFLMSNGRRFYDIHDIVRNTDAVAKVYEHWKKHGAPWDSEYTDSHPSAIGEAMKIVGLRGEGVNTSYFSAKEVPFPGVNTSYCSAKVVPFPLAKQTEVSD